MDLITLALAKKQIGANTAQAVSDYLDEHLTNPTNPPIDTSLAIAGAAADAKKTGDEISDLKNSLSALDSYVLTAQDKADIADLVLAELPTAETEGF